MSAAPLSKIEKTHLLIQIFAHATTIIAAIVLAFWGYYSVVYVKKEKEVTELTLAELNQKTTQKPHIQAKVESTLQQLTDGKNLLQVQVTISNIGNRESRVILDDNALVLVPVTFAEGTPIYQPSISLQSGRYAGTSARMPLKFVDVGAGESHEFTFIQKIEDPGVYLIHFLALNGTDPSEEIYYTNDFVQYKYAVGVDNYIVVK